jgi:hypothetical protein
MTAQRFGALGAMAARSCYRRSRRNLNGAGIFDVSG